MRLKPLKNMKILSQHEDMTLFFCLLSFCWPQKNFLGYKKEIKCILVMIQIPPPPCFPFLETIKSFQPSDNWAYCDWLLTIFTATWLFPYVSPCILLKNNFMCKCVSTLFTAEYFSPHVKLHVIFKFHLDGIGLFTLKTHTAR